MKAFASVLFALFVVGPVAAAPEAADLLSRLDAQRALPRMSFVLNLTSYQGDKAVESSTLWGWVTLGASANKTLVAFAEPASLRGRKMLMDGPTVYLLFPKTRNPIRLSPLQVLLGQSSNGDVARTAFSTDYDASTLGSETVDGKDCWVFDLTARSGHQGTAYQRVRLWAQKDGLLPLAADFYGSGAQKLKHTVYGDYRAVDDKVLAHRLDIFDGADPTRHTVLQYTQVGRHTLGDSVFRKDYLELWTPEAPQ
jgi:hypothetical protein